MRVWHQDISHDVRFAMRVFGRDRRFSLTIVVALALGIAANTTVFTFISAALLKDLPFGEPRQLVSLTSRDARGQSLEVSFPDFEDWRSATRTLTAIAANSPAAMNLSDERYAAERFRGAHISASTFEVLRVAPALGRGFAPQDERPGATPVVILGDGVWRNRYDSDPGVLGRVVRVNDVPSTVIGIMPPRFGFPFTAEVWQPLSLAPGLSTATRDMRTLGVIGRLRDGATVEQAEAELSAIAQRLAADNPATNAGVSPVVRHPLEVARQMARPMLLTLMGAVGFVLLIACANVANLLLGRAVRRSREIAVRSALGATRRRIVRQLLIECALLASVAGVLGIALAVFGVRYFGVAFDTIEVGAPDRMATPYWVDLTMDWTVFGFVAALCLGTTFVFGLVPALHVSSANVNDVLKDTARSTTRGVQARRLTDAYMVAELALTVILMTGAALMVRSFIAVYSTDPVIATTNVVTARIGLPLQRYPSPKEQKAFFARLDQQLAAEPAFASVTLASDIPVASLGGGLRRLSIHGRAFDPGTEPPAVTSVYVGPRYFETLGLLVTRGRTFAPGRGEDSAIVDERFAHTFFPNQDPLGHLIRIARPNAAPGPWLRVVGVTTTLPHFGPPPLSRPYVYIPVEAEAGPVSFISVIVRGRSNDAGQMTAVLRQHLRALDPDLPAYAIQTMDEAMARTRFPLRLIGTLMGLLAIIALVLSTIGLYGVTASGVAQRTHEVGIRMALGARVADVLWLFVRRAAVHLAAGLVVGLLGALVLGRLLQVFLRDTDPHDPLTLASVVIVLVGVAMTASVLPVRRAARLNPVTALRHE